ncbi:MAG TPA: hypothetical protein VKW76_02555 [Candidatus Binatia bacterium]|nr:hypothetical protein [Candidatus Binatia bacterium]
MRRTLRLALAVVLAAPPLALAAPVDSDLAVYWLGGGCHPTGIQPALLDMLTLINPEWAPIVNGASVPSTPVLVHGVVQGMHGDLSGDFPSTHVRPDVNEFVLLDAADSDRLATGNDDGLLHFEWEAGAFPAFAWPDVGDRVVGLGRWIFDCGHPGATPGNCSQSTAVQCVIDTDCRPPVCPGCGSMETCAGQHFGYSAELHPPQAHATIRQGRGGVLSRRPGAAAVPVTRADVFASAFAGGAGDQCVLTHRDPDAALLSVQCYPLAQSVAPLNTQDFVFDLPLPPRPAGARAVGHRVTLLSAPGGGANARLRIRNVLNDPSPHLSVRVLLSRRVRGALPTGFAGTIEAGWRRDPTPLTHVRVTLDAVEIDNALQPLVPSVPKTCSVSGTPCSTAADCPSGESCLGMGPVKSWRLQAAVNGQWQELGNLSSVGTGDVIAEGLTYDQYLPAGGQVHLLANGNAQECIDNLYGQSLATDLTQLGFSKGVACLATEAYDPGTVDVTYAGPDFGAGPGSTSYAMVSVGGRGGHCSATTSQLCVLDRDCPSGETCATTGGAYTLHYTITRLP